MLNLKLSQPASGDMDIVSPGMIDLLAESLLQFMPATTDELPLGTLGNMLHKQLRDGGCICASVIGTLLPALTADTITYRCSCGVEACVTSLTILNALGPL